MKFKIFFILFIFIASSPQANIHVKQWSEKMSQDFIQLINSNENMNLDSDLEKFIVNNFAINSISMSLIGRIANKSTDADLERYKKAFLIHITNSINNLIDTTDFNGQDIKIAEVKKDSNGYLVYSEILHKDKTYSIVWRVVEINNKYYILDIIIENTSFYVTKKSEFSNILRQNKGNLNKLSEILEQ